MSQISSDQSEITFRKFDTKVNLRTAQ